jgi:methylase of polypeptide subunit release factors
MTSAKAAVLKFVNKSNLEFKDISSEEFRTYFFPCETKDVDTYDVTIANPLYIHASESGHRIFDAEGLSHFIPKGWILLTWKAKPGKPHFEF